MSVQLTISSHIKVPRNLIAVLRRHLRRTLTLMRIETGSWSITLVDDAAMIALHARTMGLPATTDVLTFDLFNGRPTGDRVQSRLPPRFGHRDLRICRR